MSFTASWSPSDRKIPNISFSEAALSYASIQSATASNRQHALSHRCHNCKSRLHTCNDSAFFSHGPSRTTEFDPKHALKVDPSSHSCSAFCTVFIATAHKAVMLPDAALHISLPRDHSIASLHRATPLCTSLHTCIVNL